MLYLKLCGKDESGRITRANKIVLHQNIILNMRTPVSIFAKLILFLYPEYVFVPMVPTNTESITPLPARPSMGSVVFGRPQCIKDYNTFPRMLSLILHW